MLTFVLNWTVTISCIACPFKYFDHLALRAGLFSVCLLMRTSECPHSLIVFFPYVQQVPCVIWLWSCLGICGQMLRWSENEPQHDKTNRMSVRPAKTQNSLGIRPVWSEYLLSAWRKFGSLATHWAHSEDSDHAGQMPRLIWVFAGRAAILLGLSCRGSNYNY